MYGSYHYARLIRAFSAQFIPEGDGFLFRRYQKGPAYIVTQAERDAFIAAFERAIKHLQIVTFLTCLLIIPIICLISFDIPFKVPMPFQKPIIYAPIVIGLCASIGLTYRAWDAPTRSLTGRTQKAQALSEGEARRLAFSTISYPGLALGFFVGIGFIAVEGALYGEGLFWALFGGGLALFALIQTYRKWRFERADRSNSSIVSR